jgi:hypothetical protein
MQVLSTLQDATWEKQTTNSPSEQTPLGIKPNNVTCSNLNTRKKEAKQRLHSL